MIFHPGENVEHDKKLKVFSLQSCNICQQGADIIFRPYFIWERKKFKSNGFFTKFAKHQVYIQLQACYPQNSTNINLASCDMCSWRFLEFFGNYEDDPKNDPKMTSKRKFHNF